MALLTDVSSQCCNPTWHYLLSFDCHMSQSRVGVSYFQKCEQAGHKLRCQGPCVINLLLFHTKSYDAAADDDDKTAVKICF